MFNGVRNVAALRDEQPAYAALESFLPGGLAVVDRDGRQTYVSASFCQMTGWEAEELLGAMPPFAYWPPEEIFRIDGSLRTEMNEPSPGGVKLHFRRRDQERFEVMVRVAPLAESGGQPMGWVFLVQDLGERRQEEEERTRLLRERAQLADNLAQLLEATADGIYGVDREGRCTFINRAAAKMLGYSPRELLGRNIHFLIHRSSTDGPVYTEHDCDLCQAIQGDQAFRKGGKVLWRRNGHTFPVEYSSYPIVQEGNRSGAVVTFTDVTEREHLEGQLRHSQKMEAVGRLAGGIAHDFNNLLTVITGYTDVLLEAFDAADPLRENVQEVKQAAERASALTRQLLVFSRKEVIALELLDVNVVIADVEKMLQRLIGEHIQAITKLSPAAGHIRADRGQFQQIILNLAINARDAMPQGGKLTIETAVVQVEVDNGRPDVEAGAYVCLTVNDTGCGMTEEVQAHLFEPFFTTKETGKGTGLGLSMVYAIVKQVRGYINVTSAPGQGTTFNIYLPQASAPAGGEEPDRPRVRVPRGKGTILVVEDEDAVRRLVLMVLRWNGYTVLEARQCSDAVALCKEHEGPIDLLLTDVIMPQMNGRDLAKHLAKLRPDMKVLYISGYTGGALDDQDAAPEPTNFLPKPFTPDTLARTVAGILDG